MSTEKIFPKISTAIRNGEATYLLDLMHSHPDQLYFVTPFAGGSWLHFAASEGNLEIVKILIDLGMSPNILGAQESDLPLDCAASSGNLEIARYLLDQGSRIDTSASVRNPLFGAIIGRSPEIVRLLLERGIDATVRYTSPTMDNLDATAFALSRGEPEIARIIALHNANGDAEKADALLVEAQGIAARRGGVEANTHPSFRRGFWKIE